MLRQDSSGSSAKQNGSDPRARQHGGAGPLDLLQQELNRLDEIILESPRIPLSGRTLVDEEQILEQLESIHNSLPDAFRRAEEVLRQEQEIIAQAEHYAQTIVEQAKQRAAEILNQLGIIQQAEQEAQQIRQQLQQECEAIKAQVAAELDLMQHQARQEADEMHRQTRAECEELQRGADLYADRVLRGMEQQLAEMLRVIRNGRQQLQVEAAPPSRGSEKREHSVTSTNATPSASRPPVGTPMPVQPQSPERAKA